MKKKLQIFVSSTYTDLIEERQAAVEAILGSKHIPAGMELFTAGNDSQLTIIKKWIDESDIYMLILGGRYGSIERKSGKSYTQIEYEYAISNGIPVFAVVLSQQFLFRKKAETPREEIFEKEHKLEYEEFKKCVMTKVIKEVDDCKDIQIAIKDTTAVFFEENNLVGWVRGDIVENDKKLIEENKELAKENLRLIKEIQKLSEAKKDKKRNMIGEFEYEEIVSVLKKKKVIIPQKLAYDGSGDMKIDAYSLFLHLFDLFVLGVSNEYNVSEHISYVYHNIAPIYVPYGLLEKVEVVGMQWQRMQISAAGRKFYGMSELDKKNAK